MTLKELFEHAEGGVLSYEQLEAAMSKNKAKFVDLSEGNYVDKQKYTDDLASRDTRISSLDETLKTRDADLGNLRQQLESAGTDADKLNTLTRDFSDLQKKYDKDTKDYQNKLREQEYKHAVMDFANQQNFTSKAAKRDFVNSLLAKNLTVENDVIVGATDFVTAYSRDNEDAFVKETTTDAPEKPHFVDTTAPSGDTNKPSAFNFGFTGVRPHDN